MANNGKACDCGAPRLPEFAGDCEHGCRRIKAERKAEKERMTAARKKQRAALVDAEKVFIDPSTLAEKVADLNPHETARYIDASSRAKTGWKKARR